MGQKAGQLSQNNSDHRIAMSDSLKNDGIIDCYDIRKHDLGKMRSDERKINFKN